LLSCSVNNLQNAQMPRNLPAVKLATGSRNPYPIEELTASPPCLSCLPEFLVENMCEHLLLIRRFNPVAFEQSGHRLPEIFDLILGKGPSDTNTSNCRGVTVLLPGWVIKKYM
jgi:hypothetical protein